MVHSFEIVYGKKVCLTDNLDDKNENISSFMKIISVHNL